MRTVNVPPSPRIKHAISRTGYDWLQALLEIIDNSADAVKRSKRLTPLLRVKSTSLPSAIRTTEAESSALLTMGLGLIRPKTPTRLGMFGGSAARVRTARRANTAYLVWD